MKLSDKILGKGKDFLLDGVPASSTRISSGKTSLPADMFIRAMVNNRVMRVVKLDEPTDSNDSNSLPEET